MNKLIIVTLLCSFCLTSCCTVRRQRDQWVDINSTPQGASITIDGENHGDTPQKVLLKSYRAHQVVLEKDGYKPEMYFLNPRVSPKRLCSNASIPLGLGLAGLGTGLVLVGGELSGFGGLIVLGCGIYGIAAGAAIGLMGTGVDLFTGNAKMLYPYEIDAILQPIPYERADKRHFEEAPLL